MRTQDQIKDTHKLSDLKRYEKTENTFQRAFVSIQCNCVLCATELQIKITSSENDTTEVKEEAFCPQCNIRMRSKSHKVQ